MDIILLFCLLDTASLLYGHGFFCALYDSVRGVSEHDGVRYLASLIYH